MPAGRTDSRREEEEEAQTFKTAVEVPQKESSVIPEENNFTALSQTLLLMKREFYIDLEKKRK